MVKSHGRLTKSFAKRIAIIGFGEARRGVAGGLEFFFFIIVGVVRFVVGFDRRVR